MTSVPRPRARQPDCARGLPSSRKLADPLARHVPGIRKCARGSIISRSPSERGRRRRYPSLGPRLETIARTRQSTDPPGAVRTDSPYNLGMVPNNEYPGHSTTGRCELCGRLLGEDRLTRHHLLPRSRARKMRRRRKGRQELKLRDPARTVALCVPCHRNVHVSLGNAELQRGYDSVEALRDHPGVRRFTE